MKRLITGATCSAAVLAMSMAVFAQATQQPTAPPAGGAPAAQEPAPAAAQPQMTIVGCVQREADYRRAKSAGAGGAAGTGAGAGNEFVVVNATISTGATASAERPATPEAVGTSGAAGEAYELTGPGEGQAEQHVGKKVEIVGKIKDSAEGAAAQPATPGGKVDPAGQDINLKEFEVVSVREASGSCLPAEK